MPDINTYADGLLIDFADAVHAELKTILRNKFGDDWLGLGVRKHLEPKSFLRVERMLQSPMRVVDMEKQDEEIHGLEHLWNIIDGNWDLFGSSFQDRKRTEVYLDEVVELRNNLAHRRKRHIVLKSQLIRIVGNCRMVLAALESREAERFAETVDSLSSGGSPWGISLEGQLPPSDEMYGEFVGRPTELNGLSEWLTSDSPQILVWGYGGAGKSALAYKFAREVRDSSNESLIAVCWVTAKRLEFVEGVVRERYADFTDLGGLIGAIWSALYGPNETPIDLSPDRLVGELRQMPILLVVDDFDTVSENAELSEFLLYKLRDTGTRIIYTSRQRVPGIRNLEVPSFSDDELRDFISLKSVEYGDNGIQTQCLRRFEGIRNVTGGYPLFVDNLIHHAAIVGVDKAMEDWSQRKGDAAREYALRRQVEYLGHNSGDVLMALSVANRALLPVEISNIAGLTDGDSEAGLQELLQWRMVNRVTDDEFSSPAYRMNANTSRLVQQTFRDDNRLKTFSTAFKSLTGERVPEAKKRAIGGIIYRTKELQRTNSFEAALLHLKENMTGELIDSPDLHGVLGWLCSKQPLEEYEKTAREAFDRSHQLGSSKIDTYFHWASMEKNIAEWMIENAKEGDITNDSISLQWKECERICEIGIARCGPSQLLYYWAGYYASREAKARERAKSFAYAQGAYRRSIDWFRKSLSAPVSDVAQVSKVAIYRGLTLAFEGLGDEKELAATLVDWYKESGLVPYFELEFRRLFSKYSSIRSVPELQTPRSAIPYPSV